MAKDGDDFLITIVDLEPVSRAFRPEAPLYDARTKRYLGRAGAVLRLREPGPVEEKKSEEG